MRFGPGLIGLMTLFALTCCAPVTEDAPEPTVGTRLQVMRAMRDARTACARAFGRTPRDCVDRDVAAAVARMERRGRANLFAAPEETVETRARAEAAFQAAVADCRARGISRVSPRWEACNIDRAIVRLGEVAR